MPQGLDQRVANVLTSALNASKSKASWKNHEVAIRHIERAQEEFGIVSAILRVAIQYECRLMLLTVSEIQLTLIRSKMSFLKQYFNGKYFYELPILSDLLVTFRLTFGWLFAWKLASFGMLNAICVKDMLNLFYI